MSVEAERSGHWRAHLQNQMHYVFGNIVVGRGFNHLGGMPAAQQFRTTPWVRQWLDDYIRVYFAESAAN